MVNVWFDLYNEKCGRMKSIFLLSHYSCKNPYLKDMCKPTCNLFRVVFILYFACLFRIISAILNELEESIGKSCLLHNFQMNDLPALLEKCINLVELLVIMACTWSYCILLRMNFFKHVVNTLVTCGMQCFKVEGNASHHDKVVKALQDIFELVTNDMMIDASRFGVLWTVDPSLASHCWY